MSYSQNDFEEALALRKEGKDDTSIRMVLASKRLPSAQIDAIFFALDDVLPRNKIKNIEGFDSEKRKNLEKRDFFILMMSLIGIGGVVALTGFLANIEILMYLGGGSAFFGLWGYGRASRDDRREERRRNRE